MLPEVREIYRSSRKQKDIFWNVYVARPIAAVVVHVLAPRRVTPNQVTFVSLAVAVVAAATLCCWRSWSGLLVGALLLEASYVLDCADGQLARFKGLSTPVGAHLDFLMDELKAFLYVSAVALRLWLGSGEVHYLVVGLLGLAAVAAAISLTTFMRRPEYVAAAPASPPGPDLAAASPPELDLAPARPSLVARVAGLVEAGGRWIIHYPSYFVYIALLDRAEVYLYVYVAVHVLYLGRCLLQILVRLGRAHRDAAAPAAEEVGP